MSKTREPYYLIFKARGWLMVPPIMFCLLCHWHEVESPWITCLLGGSVFAIGVFVRIWSQTHLHYRLRLKKDLTTTGPYQYIRNPIYIGNILVLVGIVMMSELIWFIPIMLIWSIVIYNLVIRHEEYHLVNKYKESYITYLNTVPRWIPRLSTLKNKVSSNNSPARSFLLPSIVAELHCLIWLIIPIFKEVVHYKTII